MAAKVADAEIARLAGRLKAAGVSTSTLDEASQTFRRVVDKLLSAPTLTVESFAGSPDGEEYAAVLRVLFDLDPPISAAADDGDHTWTLPSPDSKSGCAAITTKPITT
jgi:ABC-type phosphate/phosphonate transport system substrate-binding protein